ncbi:MAG: alpha/beta hydrolase [Brevundimonas sp.]|jgi:predicted alpha/beta superfamily hydrolase|uniref:alpha/beta hydrolase n=1 Tax=Brevundimonas sp. TaxID=1871086 RepID=UPI0022C16C94|nr:alpha/beta hydrolase-fold protein [Brevundimonas sp.]
MPEKTTEMALNAAIIDFTAKTNGRPYRLFISSPSGPAPDSGWPVIYLIDGNLHFGITVDTARIQARWPDVLDPVIVGIGYQTDSVSEALKLREWDLTTPTTEAYINSDWLARMPGEVGDFGGLDGYLDAIDADIKPLIAAHYDIDQNDQTLIGHSLGGLTALHALFRWTSSFQHFVAISPSIWWDERAVLEHEAAFVARAAAGDVRARALISVGGEESSPRPMSKHVPFPMTEDDMLAMTRGCRMVENAVELGERLARAAKPGFEVKVVVHADDDHNMVPPAGIARGIFFSMRRSS